MRKFQKSRLFIGLIFLASLVTLFLTLQLNDMVITLRLLELEAYLRDSNRESSQIEHLPILAKFQNHKKLYEGLTDETKVQKDELRLRQQQINFMSKNSGAIKGLKEYPGILLEIINVLRTIQQKPRIQSALANPMSFNLALAYSYERQKQWHSAIAVYEEILLNKEFPKHRIATILLHKGYCQAIISDYQGAKTSLLKIIKDFNYEDTVITASILLQYIKDIEKEIENIKMSQLPDIVKSYKFYQLLNYNEAFNSLTKIAENDSIIKESENYHYLKARIHEETGQPQEAVKLYQKIIIDSDFNSQTATLSNRRLLSIASVSEQGDKLIELAKLNNKIINDQEFANLSNQARKIGDFIENDDLLKKQKEERVNQKIKLLEKYKEDKEQIFTESDIEIDSKTPKQIDSELMQEHEDSFNEIISNIILNTNSEVIKSLQVKSSQPKNDEQKDENTIEEIKFLELKVPENLFEIHDEPELLKQVVKNQKGEEFKVNYYNKNGKLEYYIQYEYDEKGNPVSLKKYDAQGNIMEFVLE